MKTIPQRTLRNDIGAILREAEGGEQFVVTVQGRPVAVLGPHERRQWLHYRPAQLQSQVAPPVAPVAKRCRVS